ncbi:MAG: ABC transporter substrate-binding protein [Candidatus Onthomonas sp.]
MKLSRTLKRCGVLLTAAALVGSLAACGGGSSGSGKKTLKVFLYMNDHEKEVYSAMVDKFKEAHSDELSDVELQITTQSEYATTLTGMMTANDMPDVFYVGPESVKNYVDNGYVADLTPLLDEAGISTDDLSPVTLSYYQYDGTSTGSGDLYALPKDSSTFAYAYNKDLFDEAGVEYPDPEHPYTFDEYVEVLKALTKDTDGDGEIDQWGASFADVYMMYQLIWSNGASFCSDDYRTVTIDTPEFIEAVQAYVDLTLKYEVTPTVDQDSALGPYQRWIAGQTAFYACGTWDVASFMDPETFPYNWDLCAYPTMSSGVSYTWNGTVGFCISETSENKDLALQLITYLSTDPDGQKDLSGMTGSSSVQVPNTISLQPEFKEMVNNGELTYPSNVDVFFNYINGENGYMGRMMESTYTPNSEWLDLFYEGFTNVKSGSKTVEEYIAEVQPQMQELLDKAWATVDG